MEDLLEELKKCLKDGNNYSTLFLTLALPDICGAIEYGDIGVGKRYAKWLDEYAKDELSFLSGEELYLIRCSVLHQAISSHTKLKYSYIEFQPLNQPIIFHLCTAQRFGEEGVILNLNIGMTAKSIIRSCEKWMGTTKNDYSKVMKQSYDGMLVDGLPMLF